MGNDIHNDERFLRLQIQAAWLYYMKDLTQQEIATRLGISRVKVTRLIQQARENELVTISINSPETLFLEQQEELIRRYGLQDALVTIPADDEPTLMPILADATAGYLTAHLKPGMVVGVGVGRTVSLIPRYFQPQKELGCTFVELSGGATAYHVRLCAGRCALPPGGKKRVQCRALESTLLCGKCRSARDPAARPGGFAKPATGTELRHGDLFGGGVRPGKRAGAARDHEPAGGEPRCKKPGRWVT